MFKPKYSMFFDMHTMQKCPDVGHNFDAADFASELHKAGVELVGFHAKCNQGFCYFDTQKGIRHPSLRPGHDLFGDVVRECNKLGIQVSAYFNCGLSYENALEHTDWCRIGLDGNIMHPEIFDIGWVTPYMRTMCPNSPWREYLLDLIREVRDKYPVAGFLFDSFNVFPCICPHCVAKMRESGLNPDCKEDVIAFARRTTVSFAEDISAMLEPRKNGLLTYFLGVSTLENARIGSYLECECLPNSPGWGYDYLPLYARYLRNVAEFDCPILNMTGRFNTWGDFGSLRTQEAVEYDMFLGLANGMRPNIGDHLHPRGDLFRSVFERIGNVYRKIKPYDPWFENAASAVDMAIIVPKSLGRTPAFVGFTRMLSELRMQFDFIPAKADWSKYSLIILADNVELDDLLKEKLEKYLASGGKVIATGTSGLDVEKGAFGFEKAWGCRYIGKSKHNPAYFKLDEKYADEMPDIPLATYTDGVEVQVLDGEVAGEVIAPYYNLQWDGVYSYFYTPPAEFSGEPFLVFTEQCAYCSFPLGTSYYNQTSPDLRKVLEIMLRRFLPQPLTSADKKLPSFARVFVTDKTDCRIVHLLNYLPDLRGKSLMVEDSLPLTGVKVSCRLDGKKAKNVFLAPEKTAIDYTVSGDRVEFCMPESYGYAMVVIETE